jgi:uncharacterized protein
MSRPVNKRKICTPPRMMGYKPYGMEKCRHESIILKFEEYDSIKLINYEMLLQDEAAGKMNVSRPTFTRIYNHALKSIAKAFAEGRCITIEGGNYSIDKDWYRCRRCKKLIEGIDNHTKCRNCNSFNMDELINISHPVEKVKQSDVEND